MNNGILHLNKPIYVAELHDRILLEVPITIIDAGLCNQLIRQRQELSARPSTVNLDCYVTTIEKEVNRWLESAVIEHFKKKGWSPYKDFYFCLFVRVIKSGPHRALPFNARIEIIFTEDQDKEIKRINMKIMMDHFDKLLKIAHLLTRVASRRP
jgi:hypothetical protein